MRIAVELRLSLPQIGVLNERLWYNVPNRLTYVLLMTAIRALKNQYLGINAHLHSLLQNEGGWDSFHGLHIGDLTKTLQAQLLPMGYEARLKRSLQIRRHSEKHYHAVWIYKANSSQQGIPIAWIELLTDSNKSNKRDFERYHEKRFQLLKMGVVFVEIDYLHHPPTKFDNFFAKGKDIPPYCVTVHDPRPDLGRGRAYKYQFNVDDLLPKMIIPLYWKDEILFDCSIPYKKTFEEMFYGDELDYSQLPLKFETYSLTDRQRIASRMVAIKKAVTAGMSLENEPQPIELVSLEEALQELSV
jgi:hypothetical protein